MMAAAGTLEFSLGPVSVGDLFKAVLKEDFLHESRSFGPADYQHEKWSYTLSPAKEGSGAEEKTYLHVIITRTNSDVRLSAELTKVKISCICNFSTSVPHLTYVKNYDGEGVLPLNSTPPRLVIDIDISQAVVKRAHAGHIDTLSVACNIDMDLATSPLPLSFYRMSNDLGKLFTDQEFGDVTVKCGAEKFTVYKGIICSRSAVLKAAFENDMTEAQENSYVIRDMSPDVVKEMLYFLYTGQVPKLEEMADGLMVAAEKYEISGLKEMCEQLLVERIERENATNSLIIADLNNAAYLRREALRFISENGREMKDDEDFITLMPRYPHLLLEVYRKSFME